MRRRALEVCSGHGHCSANQQFSEVNLRNREEDNVTIQQLGSPVLLEEEGRKQGHIEFAVQGRLECQAVVEVVWA